MKILFVISNFKVGGSEGYICDLFSDETFKNDVIELLVLGVKSPLQVERLGPKIIVRDLSDYLSRPARILYKLLSRFKSAIFLLFFPFLRSSKIQDYNVIHCMDSESIYVASRILTKVVITTGIYHSNEFFYKSKLKYKEKLDTTLRKIPIENVYSSNHNMLMRHSRYFAEGKKGLNVFHMGISLKAKSKKKIGLQKRVIAAGRMVGYKTFFEDLISLWIANSDSLRDFELLIVGDGPKRKRLETYAKTCPKIKFLGIQSHANLIDLIQNSFCYVGSGLTLMMAARLGVPSIVCIDNGKSGVVLGRFDQLKEIKFHLNENEKGFDMGEKLKEFLGETGQEYKNIRQKTKKMAEQFSLTLHSKKLKEFFIQAAGADMLGEKITIIDILELVLSDYLKLDNSFRNRYF